MKKLILFLITITTLTNISYASFPVTENSTGPELDHILNAILGGILFFGSLFLLIRTWWRAWRNRVRWVRILTFIVLGFLALIIILGIICSSVGCIYNMQ